jgi:hypothetical protein
MGAGEGKGSVPERAPEHLFVDHQGELAQASSRRPRTPS